jgi:hypothetical protein
MVQNISSAVFLLKPLQDGRKLLFQQIPETDRIRTRRLQNSTVWRYASASVVVRKSRATIVEKMEQHLGGIEVTSCVACRNMVLIQSPQYETAQKRHGWMTGASLASQQISQVSLFSSNLGGRSSILMRTIGLGRLCECTEAMAARALTSLATSGCECTGGWRCESWIGSGDTVGSLAGAKPGNGTGGLDRVKVKEDDGGGG